MYRHSMLAACACLALASDSSGALPVAVKRFQATPIAHAVFPTGKGFQDYRHSQVWMANQTFVYDEVFRVPSMPPDSTTVACGDVEGIGVVYYLVAKPRLATQRVRIRYVWDHSAVARKDPSMSTYAVVTFARSERLIMEIGWLRLTERLKVDGTLSLRALIDDATVMQAQFRLSGCVPGA